MPRKNCRYCDQPISRSQHSIECITCHTLSHRDCTNLDYYSGPSVFSCCLQPQAFLHNPTNIDSATSLRLISQTTEPQSNISETASSSPSLPASSVSAISINTTPSSSVVPILTYSATSTSDTSSQRKHSNIFSSPPQQINKLPRIRENCVLSETSSATGSNMSVPPTYFTDFVEANSARLAEILQAVIQGNLQNQRDREEDRQDIAALKAHNARSDRCEVVIFGLPSNTSLTYSQAAQKLITSLSLPTSVAELTFREWSVPIRNPNQNTASANNLPAPYKAFVIRFPNPYARDRLLEASFLLKSLKANDIFGEGGNIPVYVQPLWPIEVHNLFTLAVRASKTHNYARPIVVNLVVCLRENVRSRPIPIYSENDLYKILPPPQSVQSFQFQSNQAVQPRPALFFQNQPPQQLYQQFNQPLWPSHSHLAPPPRPVAPFNLSANQRAPFSFSSQSNVPPPIQPQPQPLSATSTYTQSYPSAQHVLHPTQTLQTQPSLLPYQTSSTLTLPYSLPPSKTPPASLLFNSHSQPSSSPYQQGNTGQHSATATDFQSVSTSHPPPVTTSQPLTTPSPPTTSTPSIVPHGAGSGEINMLTPTETQNSDSSNMNAD